MTVDEILEQVKTLSAQERLELIERITTLTDESQQAEKTEAEEHWGRSLNRLMDEIGPIELIYPEIEDPVEWVKQIRKDQW